MAAEEDRPPAAVTAAFFDLDRTLMQGSSAFQFGRAAYKAGLMEARDFASPSTPVVGTPFWHAVS